VRDLVDGVNRVKSEEKEWEKACDVARAMKGWLWGVIWQMSLM